MHQDSGHCSSSHKTKSTAAGTINWMHLYSMWSSPEVCSSGDAKGCQHCYVSHDSTITSTIRANRSDCHLACCTTCKICSRTKFARGYSKNATLILSQLSQGGGTLPDVLKNSFGLARTEQHERLSMRDSNDVGAIELQQ